MKGHTAGTINSVAFSSDGARLVTGSFDRTARIWDAATGKQLGLLEGHENTVTAVAFSPDGRRVATASTDGTARLWDAATGRERTQLRAHAGFVNGVAFSADERWIATSGVDALALLWPYLQGQELLDRACSLMPRLLNRAQRELHFLDPAPKAPRCGRAPLP